jgi:hypothetical protein
LPRSFIPKHNTPDKDLVITPISLAKDIIKHFKPSGLILDPCRGEGAFYNNFPKNCKKDWCELSEGKDFFNYKNKVNWIITNPPWSKIRDFIIHSTKISNNVVFLITINHYFTKLRLRLLYKNNFGLKEFYCVKTPPLPWPGSGFQLAAVYFKKNYKGEIIISGEIGK